MAKPANNLDPIITSLLDADFYKFTMQQVAFLKYPDVHVRFAFKNRTKQIKLGNIINEHELRSQLEHVRTLRFRKDELAYLQTQKKGDGTSMFCPEFLVFLEGLKLPEFYLEFDNGDIILEFYGKWPEATLWETIALSIVNELYYRAFFKYRSPVHMQKAFKEGERRLMEKAAKLKEHPGLTFTDFGTRRRFSGSWQRRVVEFLAEELPDQLIGTSNVRLAKELGLKPIGTMAHEMDMVMSGVMHESDKTICASHQKVLLDWQEVYEYDLTIALTDTYGTDFFFSDMLQRQAEDWIGLRHDSGDPIEFGEKAIGFYESHGIDPKTKLLVFSDGLNVDTIIQISRHFKGRIKVTFGWGTNLTNDLGLDPLSLVVKAVEANGNHTVKLSDNLAKATGPKEQVERFKRIFGYGRDHYEDTIY